MIICSFIGHDGVYDGDLEERLQAAVDQVVSEGGPVEFWIHVIVNDTFFSRCLLAALRARTQYPERVTITLVRMHGWSDIPACMYDRVISPQVPEPSSRTLVGSYKKKLQWLIQNSTHVISYIYEGLFDSNMPVVRVKSWQTLIDISSPETKAVILEGAEGMTAQEETVFRARSGGSTLAEAGALLGVGGERARRLLQQGCVALRKKLLIRSAVMQRQTENKLERACGLMALGEATYESLCAFKRLAAFLIFTYGIKKFYIAQADVHSAFSFALKLVTNGKAPQMIAVAGGEAAERYDLERRFCPPCDAVVCVSSGDPEAGAGDLDVMSDLLGRTYFFICDQSAGDATKRSACAARAKDAVLLDLHKDVPQGPLA